MHSLPRMPPQQLPLIMDSDRRQEAICCCDTVKIKFEVVTFRWNTRAPGGTSVLHGRLAGRRHCWGGGWLLELVVLLHDGASLAARDGHAIIDGSARDVVHVANRPARAEVEQPAESCKPPQSHAATSCA
jgi:hypothetical protein